MKITLLQEKLKEGLAVAERICSKSLTLPILNNILINVDKNFLCLEATNLEIGIKWWILAKVEKEGRVTIPSHLFSSFINFIPNENLDIESTEIFLKITHKNQTTQIKSFSAEEFPVLPVMEKENETFLIGSNSFCDSLNQIINIPSISTSRPEISGIYFLLQKNQIIMAATDSFRLGEKKVFLENPINKECSFILPQKTAKEVINIFSEKEGFLRIYLSPNQAVFEFPMEEVPHPKVQLISKLIGGEYPNYQEIIPKKLETQIILKRQEFIDQIKIASLFSKKTNEVKIKVDAKSQEVEIFSQNPEAGEYRASLFGEIKGGSLGISFNYRFLLDGLLGIKSPEVILGLNGEEGAAILKPNSTENYIYIIMPMKGG